LVATDHAGHEFRDACLLVVWHRAGYQPITMFDSMALRACSKSEPVSCM
jgi:hypothetical protein